MKYDNMREPRANREGMDIAFTFTFIWLITNAQFVASLSFTLSPSRVKLGTTGTLNMTCNVTEKDASVIYNIQIRRETDPGSNYTWETLAEIEAGVAEVAVLDKDIVNDKDFVAGGVFDKEIPINTYLTLDMNKEKLTYSDARNYRCELTYKSNTTGSVASVRRNASLSIVGDDDHNKTQSDTKKNEKYVTETLLVIVTTFLAVTNIATVIFCAWYKARTGGSVDGRSSNRTGENLIPLETRAKGDYIQGTDEGSQRTFNLNV